MVDKPDINVTEEQAPVTVATPMDTSTEQTEETKINEPIASTSKAKPQSVEQCIDLVEPVVAEKISLKQKFAIGAPRLSGATGMIIDLETNEVKEKEKSGADILLDRFLKMSGKSSQKSDTVELSIFNPDTGTVQSHEINKRIENNKEKNPKPGVAYLKLKDELSKRISDKRKEIIAKRLQEEQKNRCDVSDEEGEELSDFGSGDEGEEGEEDEEGDVTETGATKTDGDEAVRVEFDEDEEALPMFEDEVESGDSDEDDVENDEDDDDDVEASQDQLNESRANEGEKRRRIVTAFEDDSDEEIDSRQKSQSSVEAAVPLTSAISDNFSITQNVMFTQPPATGANDNGNASFEFEKSQGVSYESNKNLFTQRDDGDAIGESQLEALCSGIFATQMPEVIIISLNIKFFISYAK